MKREKTFFDKSIDQNKKRKGNNNLLLIFDIISCLVMFTVCRTIHIPKSSVDDRHCRIIVSCSDLINWNIIHTYTDTYVYRYISFLVIINISLVNFTLRSSSLAY